MLNAGNDGGRTTDDDDEAMATAAQSRHPASTTSRQHSHWYSTLCDAKRWLCVSKVGWLIFQHILDFIAGKRECHR